MLRYMYFACLVRFKTIFVTRLKAQIGVLCLDDDVKLTSVKR